MALPLLVNMSDQPGGDWTFVGVADMNPAPGTQANQNVPMVVSPMLLSVRSYSNVPGVGSVKVKVAVPMSEAERFAAPPNTKSATGSSARQEVSRDIAEF